MNLKFPPEMVSFRQEVRQFIDANLPDETRRWMRLGHPATPEQTIHWHRVMNTRGWATPTWPKEHGGAELSAIERMILLDEIFTAPAPEPLPQNSQMVGPLIIRFGAKEQKRFFLPKIANLDFWFCQGFSEPGAGSDLAALSTSAVRTPDGFVVNGQKTWTSSAHYANWIFCIVRTARLPKRQEGMSFLLIDLATPGITIRPVMSIDGRHKLNEVFFDNVRVPVSGLLGEENKGWELGKFLLGYERASIARVGRSRERLSYALELIALAEAKHGSTPELVNFRRRAALIDANLKALEMSELRAIASDSIGGSKGDPFSSLLKVKGAEAMQSVEELVFDVAGPEAFPVGPTEYYEIAAGRNDHDWAAPLFPGYLLSRAGTIYGGSNEIQKNILAKTVLGL